MNNNQSGGQLPASAPEAQSKVLVVPDCRTPQEISEFAGVLSSVLATAPAQLTLRFIGVHQLAADPALLLCEFLQQKPAGTTLVTEAWSSLMDGSALVWLLGEQRRIRRTAWLYFTKPQSEPAEPPDEEQCDLDEIFGCSQSNGLQQFDHRTILRMAGRYLPIDRLAGTPITSHLLAEYRLLEGQSNEGDTLDSAGIAEAKPQKQAVEPMVNSNTLPGRDRQ